MSTCLNIFRLGQGVIGVSDSVSRGDCSTLPGNELPLLAKKVRRSDRSALVSSDMNPVCVVLLAYANIYDV